MTHFLLLYVFYRIPELFCICLHLGIFLTSDRNIPIRDQFSQILRLMTDLQYLQTVTASEGSISDILYTLRQGHLFQERPFAECPSADKFHFFRKLQLVCCTEIKSFFPNIFQIRREMNVRKHLTAPESSVSDLLYSIRQINFFQCFSLHKSLHTDPCETAPGCKLNFLKSPVTEKCCIFYGIHI